MNIPSWRPDISQGVDIVEELVRIAGYKKIKTVDPIKERTKSTLTQTQKLFHFLQRAIASKGYLEAQLVVSLGGRAAEILVFGSSEVTQGASNDLEYVSRIAREMVTKFGFSKLGPVSLESQNPEIFLGSDLLTERQDYADSTMKAIDDQVRDLSFLAMNKAMEILRANRKIMDRLVDALIEEETLEREQFNILAGIQQK